MRYFSMFSGIGGFELGIQNAFDPSRILQGFDHEAGQATDKEQLPEQPLCIGYSEIDKYAIKVYERNFSGHRNYGDATRIDPEDLPDFDLLVGGFPCQAFSVAGKRAGFDDARGTLFFDIARILTNKRPRHLVLENVKGLLSHDGGKTFTHILEILTDLGYCVEWQVLNSKNFGVPQNRERVYIVGHLGVECQREVFSIRSTHKQNTERVQGHTANTLTARYEAAQATGTYIGEGELNAQERHCESCICHISMEVFNPDPEATDDHCETCTCAKILHNIYGGFNEGKARVFKDVSPTIRTSKGGGHLPSVLKDSRIRRLTPMECERLQGFPDRWTEFGAIPGTDEAEIMSDTQRYKMCGNAVTVNVVEAVMRGLMPCL